MKKSHFLGENGWDWETPPLIVTKSQQKSWDKIPRKLEKKNSKGSPYCFMITVCDQVICKFEC